MPYAEAGFQFKQCGGELDKAKKLSGDITKIMEIKKNLYSLLKHQLQKPVSGFSIKLTLESTRSQWNFQKFSIWSLGINWIIIAYSVSCSNPHPIISHSLLGLHKCRKRKNLECKLLGAGQWGPVMAKIPPTAMEHFMPLSSLDTVMHSYGIVIKRARLLPLQVPFVLENLSQIPVPRSLKLKSNKLIKSWFSLLQQNSPLTKNPQCALLIDEQLCSQNNLCSQVRSLAIEIKF